MNPCRWLSLACLPRRLWFEQCSASPQQSKFHLQDTMILWLEMVTESPLVFQWSTQNIFCNVGLMVELLVLKVVVVETFAFFTSNSATTNHKKVERNRYRLQVLVFVWNTIFAILSLRSCRLLPVGVCARAGEETRIVQPVSRWQHPREESALTLQSKKSVGWII